MQLDQCCRLLSHRGPDDRGTWLRNGDQISIGLGHTRLVVIDPRPEGRQPMVDVTGRYLMIYNGMIYNYRELRKELLDLGVSFNTDTDTEVILNGYVQWGERILNRLEGMWVFCIYDTLKHAGLLCRDRMGIKPLLYSVFDDQLAFASEMRALEFVSNAPLDIRPMSIHHYLRFGYIPHPLTIYHDFYKLPPGHIIHFDARGLRKPERYYQIKADVNLQHIDYEDACSEILSLIGKSTTARMVADVPLGAFLSGGLDSSIIVNHLAKESSAPIKTFSIGYKDQPQYDETAYAHLVADKFGTDHYEFLLSFEDVIAHLPDMLDHLGEPFADASLIPTSLLSSHTRRQVTVALSGDGADELFAGYHRYLGHYYLKRYLRCPRVIRQVFFEPLLAALPASKSSSFSNRIRQAKKLLHTQCDDPLERHFMWSRILSPEAEHRIDPGGEMPYLPNYRAFFESVLGDDLFKHWSDDPLNQIFLIDLLHQLPGDMLHKVDLGSMFHGLEVRVPMLDRMVTEFAISLPSSFKLQQTLKKRILQDAYRDILPGEIFSRPKMGFELPIGEFLRNELRSMFMDIVTQEVVEQLPPLHFDGVMQIYNDHRERRNEHADILYAIFVLCWWKSKH